MWRLPPARAQSDVHRAIMWRDATDSNEYRARMIIGCDGANSMVARASGLRTGSVQSDYAIDMMEETPQPGVQHGRARPDVYLLPDSQPLRLRYVFPKASHLNVGVGFKLDYYLSNLRGEHYAHHQAFVDDLKSKQLLTGQSNRANFRAFPLPISGPLARTSADRVLLAGDAGGFVNALTAEGISTPWLAANWPRAQPWMRSAPAILRALSYAGTSKPGSGKSATSWGTAFGCKSCSGRPRAHRPRGPRGQPPRSARRSSGPLCDRCTDATHNLDDRCCSVRLARLRSRENAEPASWLKLRKRTDGYWPAVARCWWVRCSPSNGRSANIPASSTKIFAVPEGARDKTEFAFARLMYPPAPAAMFDRAGPAGPKACPVGRRIIRAPIAISCWPCAASPAFRRAPWNSLSIWMMAMMFTTGRGSMPSVPANGMLTDAQAHKLRDYLLRGGFFMADDFWGDARVGRVLGQHGSRFPGPAAVELDNHDPIFHTIYDLDDRYQVPGARGPLRARLSKRRACRRTGRASSTTKAG